MFREVFLNLSFVNTFPSQQIPDKHKMNGDDHYILPFAVFWREASACVYLYRDEKLIKTDQMSIVRLTIDNK